MGEFEELQRTKRQYALDLLTKEHVIGVGIGEKITNQHPTCVLAITVSVDTKVPASNILAQDLIPKKIDGFPTDVVSYEDHMPKAELRYSKRPNDPRTGKFRPAPGGVSIGHYQSEGAGTLGGWLHDAKTDEPMLLSNWHVIANCGNCKQGDPILQPAKLDGGKYPDDVIAYLDRWVDVEMLVHTMMIRDAKVRLKDMLRAGSDIPNNTVDAAVARAASESVVSPEILGLERPRGTRELRIGDLVSKSGRTTRITTGKVEIKDYDCFIPYPSRGIALFVDQNLSRGHAFGSPFSAPRDSGSMIVG